MVTDAWRSMMLGAKTLDCSKTVLDTNWGVYSRVNLWSAAPSPQGAAHPIQPTPAGGGDLAFSMSALVR